MSIRRFSTSSLTTGSKSSKFWDQETTPGYFESIAVSVSDGTSASIVFSNIPQNYLHLQVRFMFRGTLADVNCDMYCWINGDTSQAKYSAHYLRSNGTAATAGGYAASTAPIAGTGTGSTATASMYGAGIIDILDYANTSKNTTTRSLTGEERNGAGNVWFYSNLFMDTAAVTSLTLAPQSGNFAAYSSFALYGIRGA